MPASVSMYALVFSPKGADPASLLLIKSMISSNMQQGSRPNVFFICCYREDEVIGNVAFEEWLSSISGLSLETIKLGSLSVDGVNELISDTLHVSPRLTRPLAATLRHKTKGNPLFLRQLIDALKDESYIYVDLKGPRWAWSLDRIIDMKISDNVVALLNSEMQRLPPKLQLGLTAAACMGICLKHPIIDVLSKDLKEDFSGILHQLCQRGYLDNISKDGEQYLFAHDKVQQAAYEMTHQQAMREQHMRFGLAIMANTMARGIENNDELFFTAIHQINKGTEAVLSDPVQRGTVASLNLRAGKRSVHFSDSNTAFTLFKHGISVSIEWIHVHYQLFSFISSFILSSHFSWHAAVFGQGQPLEYPI